MPDPADRAVLRGISLFKDMDGDELNKISQWVFLRDYKAGSMLFAEGTTGEGLYIVIKGGIDISKKAIGKTRQIATVGPGEVVGEMCLIDEGPRTATGKTNAASRLAIITKKNFEEMLNSDPRIAAKILTALLKTVNKRLRLTDKRLEAW
jgi:CRP-like cAMP-binding protein